MQQLQTTEDILLRSKDLSLYKNLILQLNKDFLRANISVEFREDIQPQSIVIQLHNIISDLINQQFTDYLNLLYIIDVSEEEIKKIDTNKLDNLYEQVAYLILLREWKKVWTRANFIKNKT